ncbi:MAG: Gfo/Idh/MocA family oxidoreductase [Leifsonia sp.]
MRFPIPTLTIEGDQVTETIGIIMNGVSGRMGYRQHLVRSILAIRDQGGVELSDGSRVIPVPLLVGRDKNRLQEIAERHGIERYTTDLAEALADQDFPVYSDFLVTQKRVEAIRRAIAAGKHIYAEKPTAETFTDALELARLAEAAGVKNGVVHDKLYLPGLQKLRRLIDSGFFGRILSVRGEFGYWVFEGDWQVAQRPSWNYRSEDGGGITSDMFAHWNYVIENLFGPIRSVYAQTVTHIPERVDEHGRPYLATADDAAYAIFELEGGAVVQLNSSWAVRVHRKELVEFQVDGTLGSAVVGLFGAEIQPRTATPKPVWNPDLPETRDYFGDWHELPENDVFENGFKAQWEQFIRHVVEDAPYSFGLLAGAQGVRLSEEGLRSSAEGRRITLVPVTL